MNIDSTGRIIVRQIGLVDYRTIYDRMRTFTTARTADTVDEIWLLEHYPAYTLGLGAPDDHPHQIGDIPVIKTDRGGRITYHGPGQLVAYVLIDLRRRGYGIRSLVARLEQGVIDYLMARGLPAVRRPGAPGVYVHDNKIAALGLRVKNGCSYHGLSLNVDLDLTPFNSIDPCGYPDLAVTRLKDLGVAETAADAATELTVHLIGRLQCESLPKITPQPTTTENVAHD